MKCDYKFWYIKRDDNGFIAEAAVRFFEGDVTTENEKDEDDNIVPVTRYRRSRRLDPSELPHLNGKKKVKDILGRDVATFDQNDFGQISDDDELRAFLNKEMKKDTSRDNVDEQVEEDVEKLKKLKIK